MKHRSQHQLLRRSKWLRPLLLLGLVLLFWFIQLPIATPPAIAQIAVPCATPGKDGPGGTLSNIVNTYYPPASANTVLTAGSTSLQVGSPSGATQPITVGDLLLIIQMQDADINSSNTDAYGDGIGGDVPPFPTAQPSTAASGWTSLNQAGLYEYVTVTSVSGSTIGIQGTGSGGGLINTYVNSSATVTKGQSRYQIVRVPQYSSATLGNATALPWNGSIGGILAYDVAGNLDLTGTVDVSGRGFRGGAGRRLTGATGFANTDYRTPATAATNGSKGEGIAGTPRYVVTSFNTTGNAIAPSLTDTGIEGYPNGSYARGAPGNAGGGSTDGRPSANDQNSGGGGGGNGGRGGRGGRSWSSQLPTGGFGGKEFSAAIINNGQRLFMGGGGGAGTTNDASAVVPPATTQTRPVDNGLYSSGAAGGGMVLIRTNTTSAAGTILARGATARDVGQDGGGGGGAGGTVIITTPPTSGNSLAGLTVDVRGGNGGNTNAFSAAHGPGGGGGGGVVVNSLPGVGAALLSGGTAGLAGPTGNTNPPNFDGQEGSGLTLPITAGAVPGVRSGAECAANLTVVKTTSTPQVSNQPAGTQAVYTITVTNAIDRATATPVTITDNTLPTGFTYAATTSITLANGATQPTAINPVANTTAPSWGDFSIPAGGSVTITFTVNVSQSVPLGVYQNPAQAQYPDPARTVANGLATATYDANGSTGEDVRVNVVNLRMVKRITRVNSTDMTGFVDDVTSLDDNAPNWPTPLSTYLRGAINLSNIRPGDIVEYTIYFLSDGASPISNLTLCDLVPNKMTLVETAFNGQTPIDGGLSGANQGIALALAPAGAPTAATVPTAYLTTVADSPDRGQFFPPGNSAPAVCNKPAFTGPLAAANNVNGAVLVNIMSGTTTLPNATAPGNPVNSYGFIRFVARVN